MVLDREICVGIRTYIFIYNFYLFNGRLLPETLTGSNETGRNEYFVSSFVLYFKDLFLLLKYYDDLFKSLQTNQ